MSAASCVLSEDQFLCSICLDVFTDPVSTPCGHNFCKNCITKYWSIKVPCKCPNCKEIFKRRPELKVNTFISEMAAQFRQSAQEEASSSSTEQQASKPGEVPCDDCTGAKLRDELGKTEAEVQQMIQKRQLKLQEIKHSVNISQKNADKEIEEGVQVFTALKKSVERSQMELINSIKEKQREMEKQAEGFIKELEQEISELEKRRAEVEQLSRSEDHLQSLQNFPSLSSAPLTKDWTEVRVHPPSYEGTVGRVMKQLKETIIKQMKHAELKRVQQYEVDLTLDPDTAHPKLVLSDDGKQVKLSDLKKKLPVTPQRFDQWYYVLSKQSFSSGRFYYEVQVKGKIQWVVGVARESIKRKGEITASPQKGYWTILMSNETKYEAQTNPNVGLSLESCPERVGVFVDYEEGLVSFYDVDAAALIYSFTGCSFSEKIYPIFNPFYNKSGRNSAPMIISHHSH